MALADEPANRIPWETCLNGAGEEIPAFAAVRVTSADSEGILTVAKPNTASQDVYIVGEHPIESGGYGVCTRYDPIHALYDDGDGTPADGDAYGAQNNSYELKKNNTGFIVHGGSSTDGRVFVRRLL